MYSPILVPGAKRHISTEGGQEPRWAASMAELFYRDGETMMVVEVLGTEPSFEAGRPAPPDPLHVVLNWFEELRELPFSKT